ncbi:MAG: hypothetical protein ACLQDM_17765 [Bradyrhizobium sp.]
MKVGSYLIALLACGVLSTDAAMARLHGHHSKFRGHGLASTSTAVSKPQDSGLKPQTGVADHATATTDSPKLNASDRRVDDDLNAHTRKSTKTGVSDNTDSDAERKTAHGLHPTAMRGSNPGGNESTADNPIDVRITVHQGHEIGKGVKNRLFAKPKTTVAIGTGLNQQHFRDRQAAREFRRNAIGARLDSDKTVKHDAAAAAPPVATAAKPVTDSGTQATGAPVPNAGAVVGAAPANSSSAAGAPNDHRAAGAAALVIVARNAPSISGTGLMRPGAGTSAIGGTPKIATGIISGNSVHLKHP